VKGRSQQTKGITVTQRGSRWYYRLDLEPDPLTGKRQRENRGGFEAESDAWAAAMASRQRHGSGRRVRATRRPVRALMAEWLDAVGESVKPSTRQNYADYIRAYVDPLIGDRRLQDITVPVLNLLYRRLLSEGRVKVDRNATMYAYWSEHREKNDGLGPAPAEIVAACGVTIHAARAAVLRFRRGRVPTDADTGLAPKTGRTSPGCCTGRSPTPSLGTTWCRIRPSMRACRASSEGWRATGRSRGPSTS
jgi:hypothetical protein